MIMKVTFRVRMFPTKEQENKFWQFCGSARFAYNQCLDYKNRIYEETGYSCKVQDMLEYLQDLKYSDEYSWLQTIPEAVTKQAVKDLDNAFKRFFKGLSGFPKFKKKGKCRFSFYQRTDNLKNVDNTHIKITGISTPVKIRKHKIVKPVSNPRVIFDGKYWFLHYSVDVEESKDSKLTDNVIGMDLGIKNLGILSDGNIYRNMNKDKNVKILEKRKKRLQRKISRKYRANMDGNTYVKTSNIIKLEKQLRLIERKLRNIRDTHVHTMTADLVKTKPKAIVMEDLDVMGMLKNKHLSRKIREQCFYKVKEYLKYKCKYYGIQLVLADRYYPSSKMCSSCGNRKKFLSLSERVYHCPECGMTMDRDLNAAINLRNYYFAH